MQYQSLLEQIAADLQPTLSEGKVASYIPALAEVSPEQFGVSLQCIDGRSNSCGAAETLFSIQSISKVFSLTLAMQYAGEDVLKRINVEPSGDPFNSLIQLEREKGIPRNPFINAGAICVADILISNSTHAKSDLREFVSELCGEEIAFDSRVADSERDTGFRNSAMANLMKSFGSLKNDVDKVLDVYFNQCSLRMNCTQLAKAISFLANDGVSPLTGKQIVSNLQARRITALMMTCGTYDAAGEFAFRVGLPCKSGVGGGIVSVVPNKMGICVWSPALGATGNSVAGLKALETFTTETDVSVF